MSLLNILRRNGLDEEVDRALRKLKLTEEQALDAPFETWQQLKREIKRQEKRAINRRRYRREQAVTNGRLGARARWTKDRRT